MKSSNRVLWSGIILGFFVIISTIVYFSFSSYDDSNWSSHYKDHSFSTSKEIIKGDGNIDSTTQSLPSFNSISAVGNYNIQLRTGASPQITIITDVNLQKHLSSKVNNGELQLITDEHFKLSPSRAIDVVITTPEFQKIQLTGNSQLNGQNLKSRSLTLSFTGNNQTILTGEIKECTLKLGGNNEVDLNLSSNKTLQINSAGSTKINAKGSTDLLTLNNGGDLNLQAQNLSAKEVNINGVGETKVNVHVNDQITLNTAGKTTVHYSGNPKIIKHSVGELTLSKGE